VVVVPPTVRDVGQRRPDRLETAYLLYTADHAGDAYRHVEALHGLAGTADGEGLDWLLRHCAGYPGLDHPIRLHAWLNNHRLRPRYVVAGYPPRTVDEIRAAIAAREEVLRAFRYDRHPTPGDLLAKADRRA
jgi:hypothetical protein